MDFLKLFHRGKKIAFFTQLKPTTPKNIRWNKRGKIQKDWEKGERIAPKCALQIYLHLQGEKKLSFM